MNVESLLGGKVGLTEVRRIVNWACEADNRSRLHELTMSTDVHVARNALWTLTHLQPLIPDWFQTIQNCLIDMVLTEADTAKKRMLLQILRKTDFDPIDPRADFLDYCFSKINSECEPYAVRANCTHIAYKLCCGYRELRAELNGYLEMLSFQSLSPGLKSALRQTQKRLARFNRRNSGEEPGDMN